MDKQVIVTGTLILLVACAGPALSQEPTNASRPAPSSLSDSTLQRLRAAVPGEAVRADTAALLLGVLAGGRASAFLAHALVAAYPKEHGAPTGVTTNERGQFVLELRPGRYLLRFRRIGYEEVTYELDLGAGAIDTVCVNLPEEQVRLTECCFGPQGPVPCPPFKPDSATLGRPNVRCS